MQRTIDIAGSVNVRDLGGYIGAGGRRVRWGQLYRSGMMHDLTAQDQALLRSLGIRSIYDLRSNSERRDFPHALEVLDGVQYEARNHEHVSGNLVKLLRQPDLRLADLRDEMVALYRELPFVFSESYRTLFRLAADGALPLLFNCAAGKDRTGVAAALLLTALGVAWADVVEDYMLTSHVVAAIIAKVRLRSAVGRAAPSRDEVLMPVYGVDPDYLEASRAAILARHGSIEAFLRDGLGVDDARLGLLRARLLD